MRIFIFLFFLFQTVSYFGLTQKYGTSAGIRFGDKRFGVSVRQQMLKRTTAELMFEFSPDEIQATFLPKYHFPILGKGLNLYIGAGAHLGSLKDFGITYGVDAMVGLEMKLPALPITISADFKPGYHFRHEDWFELPGAVSVHYIISKDTREKRVKARKKRKRRKERRELREERKENRQNWFDGIIKKEDSNNN